MNTVDPYVHGYAESVVTSHARRTAADCAAQLLEVIEPGMRLLDVGCGPGTITSGLAAAVAPGNVVAIDVDDHLLDLARQHLTDIGATNVEVQSGSVYELDLATDSFDAAHAHQVLQHLAEPERALRELMRVVRPGGWIAIRDADYAAMFHAPANEAIGRWHELYDRIARDAGGEPNAGRHLPAWFRSVGLTNIAVRSRNWTYADTDARRQWARTWADRVVDSGFAANVVRLGLADSDELAALADGWLDWAEADEAIFVVPHVEVLARVG